MQFFVLGSQPDISLAEIRAVYGDTLDFSQISKEILLLDEEKNEEKAKKLAGVIKTGTIIKSLQINQNLKDAAVSTISQILNTEGEGKIKFGISLYNLSNKKGYERTKRLIKPIGISVKKEIKEKGHSIRFVTSQEIALSSVVVQTNKLIESGGEFVLIVDEDKIYIGKTDVVQDFKAWSKRDYDRPGRDAKSGMLPPKLAHIMINLTGTDPSGVLLDPFCGSGTVLMEAIILGYSHLIGNDILPKAVSDTQKNIEWFVKETSYEMPELKVIEGDAINIDKNIDTAVDVVVTETYLGPPLKGHERESEIQKNIKSLLPLYKQSLASIYNTLKSEGVACIAFPAFRKEDRIIHVPIRNEIENLGFEIKEPLPGRRTVLYGRPDQHVMRELYVIKKP